MGKRKRSRSQSPDYDRIRKKIKKLESKLQKRHKHRSSSESTEIYSDGEALFPGEFSPDEGMLYLDEHINGMNVPPINPQPEVIEPNTSSPVEVAVPPVGTDSETVQIPPNSEAPSLEPEILKLLGEDPTNLRRYGEKLHKDVEPRWTHILLNGLHKDTLSDLSKTYLPPENCPNIISPKLNPEIKAALSDVNVRKDLLSQIKQNQLACGLAALGQVLNWALESNNNVPQNIIKILSDTGRVFCDNHHKESQSRRYNILNVLNKNIKDTVKNTVIDEQLFGSALSEHIKTSKAITRAGSELKQTTPRPAFRAPSTAQPQRGSLNLRGATRAAAAVPRSAPAPRRPPRDRRLNDAARGRRSTAGYTRHHSSRRY